MPLRCHPVQFAEHANRKLSLNVVPANRNAGRGQGDVNLKRTLEGANVLVMATEQLMQTALVVEFDVASR